MQMEFFARTGRSHWSFRCNPNPHQLAGSGLLFLTPTELKGAENPARPAFAVFFARLRDRISALQPMARRELVEQPWQPAKLEELSRRWQQNLVALFDPCLIAISPKCSNRKERSFTSERIVRDNFRCELTPPKAIDTLVEPE